ncbi:hypothetical protein J6590_040375 [Homalodisca vitripennis]|nr:hypothetical protein J6590_040375 [Homalodisca vitripennis]
MFLCAPNGWFEVSQLAKLYARHRYFSCSSDVPSSRVVSISTCHPRRHKQYYSGDATAKHVLPFFPSLPTEPRANFSKLLIHLFSFIRFLPDPHHKSLFTTSQGRRRHHYKYEVEGRKRYRGEVRISKRPSPVVRQENNSLGRHFSPENNPESE